MKHIQTMSDVEKAMRGNYKVATDSTPIVADIQHMTSIRKIVEFTRQMDELKAEISREVGALMGYMQGHSAMVDDNGRLVVGWKNGSNKKTIDYDSLLIELNVPPAVVARYTKITPGARVFKIEDENIVE